MEKYGQKSEQFLDFMCRTCNQKLVETFPNTANTKPGQEYHSIFDVIEKSASLLIAELITTTVPQIEVQPSDELPKKICHKCYEQLQSIYRFQQMCIQTDQDMRQLIANLNVKIKKEFSVQETHSEESKWQINKFTPVNKLTEEAQSNDVDLLQNIEVKVEICNDSEPAASVSVINDPYDDADSNVELSDSDAPLTAITIKNEVETGEQQESLPSTTNNCCSICKKSFKTLRLLNYHLKRHKKSAERKEKRLDPNSKCYECNLCERSFYDPELLNNHRLKHDSNEDIRTYTCELCNKAVSSRNSLWAHKKYMHSDEKEKYACEFCDKAFTFTSALKVHMRSHTGERPHTCLECGKSFVTTSQLKVHRFRHDTVKRFECPQCMSKFSSNADLNKHILTHKNKRHICDICDKSFVHLFQLKTHKMYHTGDKPYKCDYCDNRFVNMAYKRHHMRYHTGEKPYKCKYCASEFAVKGSLMKHLRNHIGQNVYKCELCPSGFPLASALRVHVATHKNDDEETRVRNMKALKEEERKLDVKLGQVEAEVTTNAADL